MTDQIRSFTGVIEEERRISVDYFQHVESVEAFFLSHFHADHMIGIESVEFFNLLESRPNVYIYCSPLTKKMISSWKEDDKKGTNLTKLDSHLKSLEVEQTTVILLPSTNKDQPNQIQVTLIPASHCPGSVMFLFEFGPKTVLYTGDFRYAVGDAEKIKHFYGSNLKSDAINIDRIYLDCTFCMETARTFPSRDQVMDAVILLIEELLKKGSKIFLSLSGRGFGAESIFVEINKRLNQKIHVSDWKYEIYKHVPNIHKAITRDFDTSIHACFSNCGRDCAKPISKLLCTRQTHTVETIRLTTQWHLMKGKNIDNKVYVLEEGAYRFLFSMHSSLDEIKSFVQVLKPKKITPISQPTSATRKEVEKLLRVSVIPPVNRQEKSLSSRNTLFLKTSFKRGKSCTKRKELHEFLGRNLVCSKTPRLENI